MKPLSIVNCNFLGSEKILVIETASINLKTATLGKVWVQLYTVNLTLPNVQTISDRLCIMNQKISINKMWLFVWTNCVCWIKAALFIEEELPITGYNLKKMGFWGKNLFPTRWMYLGYNMISMATLDYQKVVERLFHAWGLK